MQVVINDFEGIWLLTESKSVRTVRSLIPVPVRYYIPQELVYYQAVKRSWSCASRNVLFQPDTSEKVNILNAFISVLENFNSLEI